MSIRLGHPAGPAQSSLKRQGRQSLDSLRYGAEGRLAAARNASELVYDGDAPLITIAPTGAGKGVSVIVPTLLSYEGPVVVIDPKGENYAITSRYRRELGHEVICVDPFRITGASQSHSINPFDVFSLEGAETESESMMLAEMLSRGSTSSQDPFWDISARSTLAGIIALVSLSDDVNAKSVGTIRSYIHDYDMDIKISTWLDESKCHPFVSEELGAYMNLPSDKTRPSVLAVAQSYLKVFAGANVQKSVNPRGIALADLVIGSPQSIYLVLPPDKLRSHGSLLRLWVGVLLRAITSRRVRPKLATLFLLDECAQLGNMPILESVVTLGRGFGIQAWTFWQDLAQLKMLYSDAWRTMINNCGVVQVFGARNNISKIECCEIAGIESSEFGAVSRDEQVLIVDGVSYRSRRLNYRSDADYKGKHDRNPFFA